MRQYDLSKACWRKSSYSDDNGGDCLEVAQDFTGAAPWRKSTHSGGSGGEDCLEVAQDFSGGAAGVIPVRDSKVTDGPVILVGADAWRGFVDALAG